MKKKETRIPKQQRSIEKKNQIKQAALELFSDKGYHKTSSNEIAKKAGISIGTFYAYFSDKSDVYEELVKDLYEKILIEIPEEYIGGNVNPAELIYKYVQIVMIGHSYMPEFQKEITSLSQQYDEFRAIEEKYRTNASGKIFNIMAQNSELLRVSDVSIAIMIIHNSIEAVVHEVQFYPNDFDKDTVVRELAEMICRYVIKPEYLNPSSDSSK